MEGVYVEKSFVFVKVKQLALFWIPNVDLKEVNPKNIKGTFLEEWIFLEVLRWRRPQLSLNLQRSSNLH
jgi:hypothetical protein